MVLATENIKHLNDPIKILRWIFKVYDINGRGVISVLKLPSIVRILLK